MSIYIEGMEMPENGSCIQIVIDDDGKVYPSVEKCIWKMGSIAKAVPILPHGRLIDADELSNSIIGVIYHSDLRDAPTIIPAEEDET